MNNYYELINAQPILFLISMAKKSKRSAKQSHADSYARILSIRRFCNFSTLGLECTKSLLFIENNIENDWFM